MKKSQKLLNTYAIKTLYYAGVCLLIVKETGEISASMKNAEDGLGVPNISDVVLKEIHNIYKTKRPYRREN